MVWGDRVKFGWLTGPSTSRLPFLADRGARATGYHGSPYEYLPDVAAWAARGLVESSWFAPSGHLCSAPSVEDLGLDPARGRKGGPPDGATWRETAAVRGELDGRGGPVPTIRHGGLSGGFAAHCGQVALPRTRALLSGLAKTWTAYPCPVAFSTVHQSLGFRS